MQPIVESIWRDKYRFGDEKDRAATIDRYINAVCANESAGKIQRIRAACQDLRFCPGGRIIAGAGADRAVTLINCYVSGDIQDSMATEFPGPRISYGADQVIRKDASVGILDAHKEAMLTLQMGGGIGMDFSTIRPEGAVVKRTGSIARGPLAFMEMWNSGSNTVLSAGGRYGAMMATLRCDHPDIEKFIDAKHEKGRLTNFNVSVLVTDAFMEAVKYDLNWDLVHVSKTTTRNTMQDHQVWKTLKARDLWDKILRSTYEYAEPGVIFIDRINEWNNLGYCEKINATNPCGEQPLPPYGACNLGAVNLAMHVKYPFTDDAQVDWLMLDDTVECGVIFLDDVLDITRHPLPQQEAEAKAKRRIGLGVTGLANMLHQLGLRYGSVDSVNMTKYVMSVIATRAYAKSNELAKERGAFPAWDANKFIERPFVQKITANDPALRESVSQYGLRNGVLLTVAPTGTTSIFFDHVAGGIEPTFAWNGKRKVLMPDKSHVEHDFYDWSMTKWAEIVGSSPEGTLQIWREDGYMKTWAVTAQDISVDDHLAIQAACQEWVDASISKTINVPREMPFEDFAKVYDDAYRLGCKGCTTYRPSDMRGSVLEATPKIEASPTLAQAAAKELERHRGPTAVSGKRPRGDVLTGRTYKLRWHGPDHDHAYYLTVNDDADGRPFEVFLTSQDTSHYEWTQAVTRLISSHLRRGEDMSWMIDELKQVHATSGGQFVGERHYPSLVALIGATLEKHVNGHGKAEHKHAPPMYSLTGAKLCPQCNCQTLIRVEGCDTCTNCVYMKCG